MSKKPQLTPAALPKKPERSYEKEKAHMAEHGFVYPLLTHAIRDAVIFNTSPNHIWYAHRLAANQAAASAAATEHERQRQALLQVA